LLLSERQKQSSMKLIISIANCLSNEYQITKTNL